MKDLVYEIKLLCKRNGDGSASTQKKRERTLMLIARQLSEQLGYQKMRITSLKPKHVEALISQWQSQNLAISTIKSRMSQMRWWADKVNKQNVIARSNRHYNIENREYAYRVSKACDVSNEKLNAIKDDYVKASVGLAKAFGLRKEEAIKFQPSYADRGDYLQLKASWCKGGRERTIPILTENQRSAIENAKSIAGTGSLIPSHLKYYQQRSRYEASTRAAGLEKLHGLRHQYAQLRYEEITGWECPHRGGPRRSSLKGEQRRVDVKARIQISNELGHNRIQIVVNYIGC